MINCMYGLTKLAASFDARRNKQYWQMLKRLHGGSDEAVQAIKESGDDGIWHGTRARFLPEIEQEGLKPGGFREFGVGTFFGDKHIADLYAESKVMDGAIEVVPSGKDNKRITDLEGMRRYVEENPNRGYELLEGATVRLAKPSELKGTKTLYPDVNKVKVFDMRDENYLDKVAPSQTRYMPEYDDGVKRAKNIIYAKIKNGKEEEVRPAIEAAMNKHFEIQDYLYDKLTPKQREEKLRENVDVAIQGFKSGVDEDGEFVRAAYVADMRLGEVLADKLMIPRNQEELNQLQYYGKLRGRRVFERLNPKTTRKEMFVDQEGVPPELLRHADGRAMESANKSIAAKGKSEAETSQTTPITDKSMWPYIGIGAAGVGTGVGLAYLAHRKKKTKREEEGL